MLRKKIESIIIFFFSYSIGHALECRYTIEKLKGHLSRKNDLSPAEVKKLKAEFRKLGIEADSSKDIVNHLLNNGFTLKSLSSMVGVQFSMLSKVSVGESELSNQRLPRLLEIVKAAHSNNQKRLIELGLSPDLIPQPVGLPSKGSKFYSVLTEVQGLLPDVKGVEEFAELFIAPQVHSTVIDKEAAKKVRTYIEDWIKYNKRSSQFKASSQRDMIASLLAESWLQLSAKEKKQIVSRYLERKQLIKNYDPKKSLHQNIVSENERMLNLFKTVYKKGLTPIEILKLIRNKNSEIALNDLELSKRFGIPAKRINAYLDNQAVIPEHLKLLLNKIFLSILKDNRVALSTLLKIDEKKANDLMTLTKEKILTLLPVEKH